MSPSRREAAIVAAVALVARLSVVAWAGTRFPPAHDGVRYDALGVSIAEGRGYSWVWPNGTASAVSHYPVGYPAALALAYRLFAHSVVIAGIENACFGAVAALAVHGIVLAVADRRTALWSGVAVALHPGLVLYTPGLMTEGLTSTLVTAAAWAGIRGGGRAPASAWRQCTVGALLGFAGLVRPQSLLLTPIFGALSAGRRGALLCCLVAALVCAPWIGRNCYAVHRCTLSTNSGWNLLIGAQDGASGAWEPARVPDACKGVFGESETDACFGREAARDIAQGPARWLARIPKKLAATFDYGGIGGYYLNLSNPAEFPWSAVLGAGAFETVFERAATALCLLGAAIAQGPRRRSRRLLAIGGAVFCLLPAGWVAIVALCTALACLGARVLQKLPLQATTLAALGTTAAVHAVFFGAPRYALLVAPLLTANAIVSLRQWREERRLPPRPLGSTLPGGGSAPTPLAPL